MLVDIYANPSARRRTGFPSMLSEALVEEVGVTQLLLCPALLLPVFWPRFLINILLPGFISACGDHNHQHVRMSLLCCWYCSCIKYPCSSFPHHLPAYCPTVPHSCLPPASTQPLPQAELHVCQSLFHSTFCTLPMTLLCAIVRSSQ